MDLNLIWFLLLTILLTGYAILDGFDLGVGIVFLTIKGDVERRIALNAIGPIWDGNEVWLVTFGGALMAAFPEAYATVFSAFYLPFILLLFALIFRAVSIEFRSKLQSKIWRTSWDIAFSISSIVATFLFGVAVGNSMIGLPLAESGEFVGTLAGLVKPYPLLTGALAVSLFAMHGSTYLYLKTEGSLQKLMHNRMWETFGIFLTFYLTTTIVTLITVPRASRNFGELPWAWIVVLMNVSAVANIPRSIYFDRPAHAFASGCCAILALTSLLCFGLYPNLITSNPHPEFSLTIYNAASSPKTLKIMAWIALIGMPFVLSYTAVVYWTFRGKVKLGDHSY